ncbi:MAG TPA: hypothetical protein VEA16_11615 [Vicinamibacterales bacterium]|nr:hypothetical protein [Vicinamibacterales bacterium]
MKCALFILATGCCLLAAPLQSTRSSPGTVEVLKSVNSLAPHIVGLFREPIGCKQTANGDYYVFDRRGHTVYVVNASGDEARKLVQIGAEDGRLIEPSAFDVAFNGSFAVADAPNRRERVQLFDAAGIRTGGFLLPGRGTSRVVLGSLSLNGVGTLSFNGRTLLMSHPESGWLMSEYALDGTPVKSIGQLRKTGHESDRDLHFAHNAGIPIADGNGGFYFVFMAGAPAFRKYDTAGELVFERVVQGRDIDPLIRAIPDRWPRRAAGELPLVAPTVRTAAVDRAGRLWISFILPISYVYDVAGEKVRTVQFRAAGVLTPSSLSFNDRGRVLVTPGCYEFSPG